MAKNVIGTIYDDNAVPVATPATGMSGGTVSGSYTSLATLPVQSNGVGYEQRIGAQGVTFVTSGGKTTAAIAVGTTGPTVVKASAGRLCRIAVTAAAGSTTGTTTVYDNASAGSGTVLAVVPNNTAVGIILDVQMPAANGITVAGGANSPAMTVSYV